MHAAILNLYSAAFGQVFDVGAGIVCEAIFLVAKGNLVIALETTVDLRTAAALHLPTAINRIDVALRVLEAVTARGLTRSSFLQLDELS